MRVFLSFQLAPSLVPVHSLQVKGTLYIFCFNEVMTSDKASMSMFLTSLSLTAGLAPVSG